MSGYCGRLAPSPTGRLHLGHASTFRTAYKRARERGGRLLLRNEDLDPLRSKAMYLETILEDLEWLGIRWEPPMISQSERIPLYCAAFERLRTAGMVYPCLCSRRDLEQMTQAPNNDDEPVYDGRCRERVESPGAERQAMNYRFRVPDGETIRFTDDNFGLQEFTAGVDFGDFLVWRKDGLPSYQLACVVDDADTRVTEVVRGADLLKSTARQILLQRALGLPPVEYFHTRLMTDERGVRLAKRHDALALQMMREQGVPPEAVLRMLLKDGD